MCSSCGIHSTSKHPPSPFVWGPIMWRYLYNFSVPSTSIPLNDLITLMQSLDLIMPCEDCQQHYRKFKGQFAVPSTFNGIQHWLHALQSSVRARYKKEPLRFFQTYKTDIPSSNWTTLFEQITRGVNHRVLHYLNYKNTAELFLRFVNAPIVDPPAPIIPKVIVTPKVVPQVPQAVVTPKVVPEVPQAVVIPEVVPEVPQAVVIPEVVPEVSQAVVIPKVFPQVPQAVEISEVVPEVPQAVVIPE
jgi:hypothetical protein